MPVAAPRTTDLPAQLNLEWAALRHSPTAAAAVTAWASLEPSLADARTLPDVEAVGSDPRTNDPTMAALLRLAQNGDQLAARTLLQLLLGAAINIARRTRHHAGGDLEEAQAAAIAALWEAIAEYPLTRRRGNHADGLSLEVLRRLTGHTDNRPGRAIRQPHLVEVPCPDVTQLLEHAQSPTTSSEANVRRLLIWGLRRQLLTPYEARLLLALHSSRVRAHATPAQLAQHLGLSHAALRQRTSRATRRLADAVQQDRVPQPDASRAA